MLQHRPVVQIFARTINGIIGNIATNDLPFKSSVDLQTFKTYTVGNIVIMGRKTAASLNFKPLKDRINVIISHELKEESVSGFLVYSNIVQLMKDVQDKDKFNLEPFKDKRNTSEEFVYIIGGLETYKLLEYYTEASIVTVIDKYVKRDESSLVYHGKHPQAIKHHRALPIDKYGDDPIEEHYLQLYGNNSTLLSLLSIRPPVNEMHSYTQLVDDILNAGDEKEDRTGTGTISLFGQSLAFYNVSDNPPLLTTRRLPLKATIGELLWFITGCTDVRILREKFKCSFWNEWADEQDRIGPMYGAQWRGKTDGIDQLQTLLDDIVNNPFSRRLLVDAWNPKVLPDPKLSPQEQAAKGLSSLAPCHFAFQLNVTKDFEVDLQWYQRSADVALGLPVNIASYYFLLCILCKAATEMTNGKVEYKPRHLFVALGDAHIYNNHIEQAREMVSRRELRTCKFTVPDGVIELFTKNVKLDTAASYQDKLFDGIENYEAHPNVILVRNV